MIAEAGNDVLIGLGRENTLNGNKGSDALYGVGQNNQVSGGDGADFGILAGMSNKAALGTGNDIAVSIGKESVLEAGDGNDFLIQLGLDTKLEGGEGSDLFFNFSSSGQGQGDAGDDAFLSFGWGTVDILNMSGLADNLYLLYTGMNTLLEANTSFYIDSLTSWIYGDKALTLDGGTGNDYFASGFGTQNVNGGKGNDSYVFYADSGAFNISDSEGQDKLTISDFGLDFDLSRDNLVLKGNALDIVHNNQSYGRVDLSGFGADDMICYADQSISYTDLAAYWTNKDAGFYSSFRFEMPDFDALAVIGLAKDVELIAFAGGSILDAASNSSWVT